jgi:transposase
MPRKPALSDANKQLIADEYTARNYNQTELADLFGVARRTVQRALIELGIKTYNEKKPRVVTEDEESILDCAKKHGLNAANLNRALYTTALTKDNIQRYLTQLSPEGFANLISVVGYLRVSALAKQQAANAEESRTREAAND